MISLSINITSTTLTLQSISGNDITLTVGVTTNELSLSIDRGISLETVKADPDIKNAIDNAHIQNSDTILDEGGDNEVTAEECLIAYNHSQSAHAPSNAQKNVQSDWDQTDDTKDDFIKNKPTTPEFSNVVIPALNTTAESGGEISTTLWAWIQSVFSSIVAKSVKSFIIGAFTILKDHIGAMDIHNGIIAEYTSTEKLAQIDISNLNISEKKHFVVEIYMPQGYADSTYNIVFRVNGIASANYQYGTAGAQTLVYLPTGKEYSEMSLMCVLKKGNLMFNAWIKRNVNGAYTTGTIIGGTHGLSLTSINSLSFIRAGSTVLLPAGTNIIIKYV